MIKQGMIALLLCLGAAAAGSEGTLFDDWKPAVAPASAMSARPQPNMKLGADVSPEEAEKLIGPAAKQTIAALQAHDMKKLKKWVHPVKGIRFSPYATVQTGSDRVVARSELRKLPSSDELLTWGTYDGSGDPIRLTFRQYYKKFVYDRDYAKADDTAYNRYIKQGNSMNNLRQAYPHGLFVEYHFKQGEGLEGKNEMGWSSLRLVFEPRRGKWLLVGIVHDQWTI